MQTDIALQLAERFSALTPEQRRAFHKKMSEQGITQAQLPIPPRRQALTRAPLSFAQQRQWFLWQLDPASSAYHIAGGLRLRGRLQAAAVQSAFDALIARHESLRTYFVADADGLAEQCIAPPMALRLAHADLRGVDDGEARLARIADDFNQAPFDLASAPLLRAMLVRLADEEHVLLVVMHHIVSDGWSIQLVIEEFGALYQAAQDGGAAALAPLPIQYADHAAWQRHWLDAGERDVQLAYWTARLGDEHPVLQPPADHPRQAQPDYHAARFDFALPPELGAQLHRSAQRHGATVFMLLLAAFKALLYRHTGQQALRIGVPMANRNRVETEGVIGFFVNTLIIDTRLDGRTTLEQLLLQVRDAALGAQAHQDLPFDVLVDALQPERSLSHPPLFQLLFNHQHLQPRGEVRLAGLSAVPYELGRQAAKFELTLDTQERADGNLSASFAYAVELFEQASIARLSRHYLALLRALVDTPQCALGDVPLQETAERAALLAWSRCDQPYAPPEAVHLLIERQAAATPQADALLFGDEVLSYAALNGRANALAHRLIALGVGPEVRVGLALLRSVEMVVGLLAVMKAGGAYVPIDPEYPAERIAYMLDDSAVSLLLTHAPVLDALPVHLPPLLMLDQQAAYADGGQGNPRVALHGENLAYVIYTSGSTGRPKGAANRHDALYNRLVWMQQAYALGAGDTVLQKTPFSFDVSVWEFFWPLMYGARLAVAGPGEHRDPALLAAQIERHGVTTMHFVPSMLQAFVADLAPGACASLRTVICSGEALPADLQDRTLAVLPQAQLHNLYGPTEAAIDVTWWHCRAGDAVVPIGRPIANLRSYVLDDSLNLAPAGVAGELYLGGVGLARGYLHRPGLSAERFVPDPFDGGGARLYRTGDLVRWRADGALEYLGRIDHQIKIRGLRVELGEIEAQLLQQPGVAEAVVVAQASGQGLRLVAYVTPATLDTAALRAALAVRVPDYMVPSALVALPRLPLNGNGKLDRKALPAAQFGADAEHAPAEGEVENMLARLWCEVLGLERVGREDNFFELGGDSILSLQIVARARQAGWKLTPKQLFERQSIAALALVAQPLQAAPAAPEDAQGEVPLLPIQLDFFAAAIPQRHHWNQSLLMRANGALDAGALERALQALVAHHQSLSLRFRQAEAGAWRQSYGPVPAQLLWQCAAQDGAAIEAACREAQRSLDLEQGRLLRAQLIAVADGSTRLFLAVHHLAVDGVSWRVLLEDLETAYRAALAGTTATLPPRGSSLQAWSLRLRQHAHTPAVRAELPYWLSLGDTPVALPCARPDGANTTRHARDLGLALDRETTRRLLKEAPAAYRTQVNDLLLTALGRALCRYTGQAQVVIELEGHGREDLFDDLDASRTVGWYTSVYPVRLAPLGEAGAAIRRVKQDLRDVPARGIGYGLLRHLGDDAARAALAALPRPQLIFNYLGQFDGSFEPQGLWAPAAESGGETQDSDAPLGHELALNGQVLDGVLKLTLSFSAARHDADALAALMDDYRQELVALVAHCCSGAHGVTPSDFPLARLDQAGLDALALPVARLADLYPLSPMQAGMLFHSVYAPQDGAYLNQLRVDIDGLDAARFAAAWQAVIARHDILRTAFLPQAAPPLQWVSRDAGPALQELDWRGHDDIQADLDALAQRDLAQGFVLEQAPLQRLHLVRTSASRHHFIWTNHHLLLDGWSSSRLMGELLRHYAGQPLATHGGRYRDYIAWLQRQDAAGSESYWRALAAPLAAPTRLAGLLPCEAAQDGHAEIGTALERQESVQLAAFARRHHVTVNTVVQAAWAILLQRHTGQRTVAFGATVAGRPGDLAGAQQLLGLFINTLPVIATPRHAQTVAGWLAEVQAQSLASREHEHTPLVDIQRWAGQGAGGLFDTLVVFENYPVDEALTGAAPDGLVFSAIERREQTSYPLTLAVMQNETLALHYGYDQAHFDAAGVAAIGASLLSLLRAMMLGAQQTLGSLALTDARGQQQLRVLAHSDAPAVSFVPVHQRIARHAALRPDAPAVVMGGQQISHAQLERRAHALARRLRAHGVGAEMRVGVALERSIDMIVALLAVLKAGAAYVPLDPDYPAGRLAYMMDDSGICLLIAQQQVLDRVAAPAGVPLLLMPTADAQDADAAGAASWPAPHRHNLAYLIYTSGSTGKPKGVAVTHGPLDMHCAVTADLYEMGPHSRELHFLSFAFDGAHERWLTTLCAGGALVLRDASLWTPEQTYAALRAERITNAGFPPAYLKQLAEWAEHSGNPPPVELYSFGGEAMPQAAFEQVCRALKPRFLINGYGPTEAVVTPMVWKVGVDAGCRSAYAPIGRPVGARSAWVLDDALSLAPPGVPGELYLGGEGLARGYLGRPGMTADRFIPDPFDGAGGRLYRTGDLVRWQADGQLEYLGRIDHQVKIRGFRIELGEVEAQLLAQPGVLAAVAVAQPGVNGNLRLVAYVAPAGLQPAGLKLALARQLPDYMVPSVIVALDSLPLNANGKVDRNALPAPQALQQGGSAAPQGPAEQLLAQVWRDVLGLEQLGRDDNFFEVGGDSIMSLQIVARLRQAGWIVTPKQLFERQSVAALAPLMQAVAVHAGASAEVPGDDVPLLPIQSAFFAARLARPAHFNQSVLLHASAAGAGDVVAAALDVLLRTHAALRLRFGDGPQGWSQQYGEAPDAPLLWRREARDAADVERHCQLAQRSLDIRQGQLLRAVLMSMADGSVRLLLVVHHLVVDGVSWRILLQDLDTLCRQGAAGQPLRLAAASAPLQAWSRRLRAHAASDAVRAQLPYWQALAATPACLPLADSRGASSGREVAGAVLQLDRDTTRRLLKEAPAAYRTQVNDLLLTALGRALCRHAGEESFLVELEGHGREDLFEELDISRTVGWFTSAYPVRLAPLGALDAALKRVKQDLRAIPDKGIGYGLLKYMGCDADRQALAALAPAQVLFNYLGQFDGSFEADAAWRPADEPSGDAQDPDAPLGHELVINGQVFDGMLKMTFSYSSARHDGAAIRALVDDFGRELQALVAHCCSGALGVTPSDFPLARLDQARLDALDLPLHELADLYPLSPMQAGMLFHSLQEPQGSAYVNQLCVDVEGLDAQRFADAWRAVAARHDILRSRFVHDGGEPLQWVSRAGAGEVAVLDWRGQDDSAAALDAYALADLARGFDLAREPLQRLSLIRRGGTQQRLVWTSHHLLLDGWSTSQLMGEILRHYHGEPHVPAPGRYRDYIAWLQRQDGAAGEAFWRAQLAPLATPTRLSLALPAAAGGTGQDSVSLRLEPAAMASLAAFARHARITVNTVVQGAWLLLLQRYTGQACVAFGATVAGRPANLPGADRLLGMFINTLPVIAAPHAGAPVGEWLRQLQAQNLAGREFEHTPLYEVQRLAGQGGVALFDSIIVFENYPVDAALRAAEGGELRFSMAGKREETNYPWTLAVMQDGGLTLHADYARASFDAASARLILEQLGGLMQAMARDADAPLGALPLLSAPHGTALLRQGRNEGGPWNDLPVHAQFELQAVLHPDALALLHEDEALSYRALNLRANRLAHALLAQGAGPEVRVGIAVERSVDMLAGLLAILKTGAAYVPLDPGYPAERLAYMIADSGMALLLTQASVLPRLILPANLPVQLVERPSALEHDPGQAPLPQQLAYVIYTSGSTGKPKGVGIAHQALSRHAQVSVGFFGLTAQDRVLQFSTLNFDGFVEQAWPTLCIGAALVLRGPELWDSETFYQALHRYRISVADLTTAYWSLLAQDFALQGPRDYGALRQVHAGGEAMPPEALQAWRQAGMRHIRLLNTYGPTEAAVTAATLDCAPYLDGAAPAQMPIGLPLAGRALQVLDADMALVPPGAAGELCIGGALLARGYLGRAALTAERFVPDPHGAPGARLYRTGDLVRWRAGQLDYLGRIDHQIKIRGFRVELGEIEAQLLAQPGVREAVVVAQEGAAGARLVAYVSPAQVDVGVLRVALAAALPDYMLPAAIVALARLPLSPAGKVERSALPAPQLESEAYAAPQGELEQALAAIWSALLGVPRVGRDDNFFALGGHSLLAVRCVTQVNQMLRSLYTQDAHALSLADLFGSPTLAALAARFGASAAGAKVGETWHSLRAAGDFPPLFCCPGLLVNAFEFQGLAQALGPRQPVHGFVSHALGRERWADISVTELACRYADIIVANSPGGECSLAGWSLGAVLAQETARQLQGRVAVRLVGMIDPVLGQFDDAGAVAPALDPLRERALREQWLSRSGMRERWEQLFERMSADEWAWFVHLQGRDIGALPLDGDAVHCKEYLAWSIASHALMLRRHRPLPTAASARVWVAEQTRAAGVALFDSRAHFAQVLGEEDVAGAGHLDIIHAPALWQGLRASLPKGPA
ncbi:non-ribosomal peptide synthetase [Janthinobacterium sp. 1_2014MBL_MicDiv]|uniref:non-ribosomal peptide synthetase n=1 Tax=Janthinobacterium sp. 1_2014MBL_MicDiv TaxID=1644131 RepID=UPI0008F5412F|nr:non-ribosomal peptide synthetase [Janthinobacterium sp. 1_2014MBL_MicDiv]